MISFLEDLICLDFGKQACSNGASVLVNYTHLKILSSVFIVVLRPRQIALCTILGFSITGASKSLLYIQPVIKIT